MRIVGELMQKAETCCWRAFRVVEQNGEFRWGCDYGCSEVDSPNDVPFGRFTFNMYAPIRKDRFDDFESVLDNEPFSRQVKSDFADRIAVAMGLTVDEPEGADETTLKSTTDGIDDGVGCGCTLCTDIANITGPRPS